MSKRFEHSFKLFRQKEVRNHFGSNHFPENVLTFLGASETKICLEFSGRYLDSGMLGIYFIFLSWNININGILASAGVLGVVLGLAAKDTVANFFAGIFLMADSPFKEGDYILLDTGERGYVKSMGLRSTRFMTRDDIEITIPNSVIASSKIVNESGGPEDIERVRISLIIAYGSDIDEVKSLLKDIALKNKNVQNEPEPRVRFREFAESGLKLQLLFWIYKPEIRGKTVDRVNTEIYKQFALNNISIPYPTMKVLMPEK